MMAVFKFIISTWLASFIPAAYCQLRNSNSELICNLTIYKNEWQSKLIDSCPENYKNEDIVKSCEHFISLNDSNVDLFTPVTNNITKITYTNKYCGYCNNDNDTNWEWIRWNIWTEFKKSEDPCLNYTSKMKASEVSDLEKWVQTFISDGMTLETSIYLRKLQCFGKEKWPINLLYNVIPCLVEKYSLGQYQKLYSCQYFEKNGRSCNKMEFVMDGYYFSYRDEKFYRHLSQINLTGGDYIVPTENDDIFYLCKTSYQAGYWGKLLRIGISIAILVAYLVMNFDKQYFQIFSNQLLYIYSIGLIVMFVLLTYTYLKFPVSYVSFNLAKMFWTYHFLWTTLFLIVFCHLAFGMCNRCEHMIGGAAHKCYLWMLFVFGLVLPISLPIMYLDFLKTYKNHCASIPGHMAVPDVLSENLQFLQFVLYPSLAFLLPIIFVAGIFCILSNRSHNSDEVRSATSRRNSPVVLFKMLFIMGIHWGLYKLCLGYYGNENSYTIVGLSINMDTVAQWSQIDIHGLLVFFVLLIDNSQINDILIKHGYKRGITSQPDNTGATETSAQFQS